MKTTFAAAIIFIVFPLTVSSQFLTGFGIKAGITSGMQEYDYSGDVLDAAKPILGFNASLFTEMMNNKYFNIVLDGGYEQRGNRMEIIRTDEFGNQIGTYDAITRTHYLSFGLLGKIKFTAGSVTPYLVMGPRADIYLGYKNSISDETLPPMSFSPIHEDTKKINYSINLGTGLQFDKLLPFKTMIEFNYSPKINSSYNNGYLTVKDNYFNIKLGINFIKGKNNRLRK